MQYNDDKATPQHDKVDNQMCGTCPEGLTVQGLVLIDQTDCCDLGVGDQHTAYRGGEQNYGETEAVDVVDGDVLTGELEQRGVVTIRVRYECPAAVQAKGQTQQNGNQEESCTPG